MLQITPSSRLRSTRRRRSESLVLRLKGNRLNWFARPLRQRIWSWGRVLPARLCSVRRNELANPFHKEVCSTPAPVKAWGIMTQEKDLHQNELSRIDKSD
jgi:hypothetical protein